MSINFSRKRKLSDTTKSSEKFSSTCPPPRAAGAPWWAKLSAERKDLQWFVGFAEGCGSWAFDKKRGVNEFIINHQDSIFLEKIITIFGFGKIKDLKRYYRLTFSNQEDILILIKLCNGNFRLEKTKERFEKFLDYFNSRKKLKLSTEDHFIPFDTTPIETPFFTLENGWLSGFCDAGAYFTATIGPVKGILLKFSITKKGEKALIDQLLAVFGGNYHTKSQDIYYYELQDMQGIQILVDYLKKFSLKSQKAESFQIFEKIFFLKVSGKDKTPEGWAQITSLYKQLLLCNNQGPLEAVGSSHSPELMEKVATGTMEDIPAKMDGQKLSANKDAPSSLEEYGVAVTSPQSVALSKNLWIPNEETAPLYLKPDLQWLVGFAEGDGCWYADHTANRNMFIINQKDPTVLYKVREILGFGTIKPYGNHYRFVATSLKDTLQLIKLFNGNLVLEKTQKRFAAYLQIFNERPKVGLSLEDRKPIPLLKREEPVTLNEGWLAGFIDAEGCFNAYLTTQNYRTAKIYLRFTLVQKGEKKIFDHLGNLLGASSIYHEEPKDAYRLQVLYENILQKLLAYLQKFPLYSIKNLSKQRFEKLLTFNLTDGKFKTPEEYENFYKLCKEINKFSTVDSSLLAVSSEKEKEPQDFLCLWSGVPLG